jgi:four helix bundle protein
MQDFRSLLVWKKSHQLTLQIYKCTKSFPKEELFGLTSQIRRSVSSIPANIAEGCGRQSDNDFARFLQIAMGSACELEYHLLLALDLELIQEKDYKQMNKDLVEVKTMLTVFIRKLRNS